MVHEHSSALRDRHTSSGSYPARCVKVGSRASRLRPLIHFVLLVALLGLPIAVFAAPEADSGVYTVQWGDTLANIAARHGVSAWSLAEANGISNPNFIYVGQQLVIPGGSSEYDPEPEPAPVTSSGYYIVKSGDTLANIAARYGVTVGALAQANGLSNVNFIWVGQTLSIPGSSSGSSGSSGSEGSSGDESPTTYDGVYVVQAGDTLARIAARYGTTIYALMSANGIANPNFIWVGQRLAVNGASSGSDEPSDPGDSGSSSGGSARWIDIDLSQQTLTAFEGDNAVFSTLISGGTSTYPTVVGQFAVYMKLDSQTMSGPGYWLPGVPYVMYFYSGYAIHGTYWHSNFGQPMSHGCINMTTADAGWLYGWASVGTTVVTHW